MYRTDGRNRGLDVTDKAALILLFSDKDIARTFESSDRKPIHENVVKQRRFYFPRFSIEHTFIATNEARQLLFSLYFTRRQFRTHTDALTMTIWKTLSDPLARA